MQASHATNAKRLIKGMGYCCSYLQFTGPFAAYITSVLSLPASLDIQQQCGHQKMYGLEDR